MFILQSLINKYFYKKKEQYTCMLALLTSKKYLTLFGEYVHKLDICKQMFRLIKAQFKTKGPFGHSNLYITLFKINKH